MASELPAPSSENRQLAGDGLAGLVPSYPLPPHLSSFSVSPQPSPASLHICSHFSPVLLALSNGYIRCQSCIFSLFPECPIVGEAPPPPHCSTFHASVFLPDIQASQAPDPTPGLSRPLHLSIQPPPWPWCGLRSSPNLASPSCPHPQPSLSP